jgi:hypothetical protein
MSLLSNPFGYGYVLAMSRVDRTMTRLFLRCCSLCFLSAFVAPAFAFEPLQKSFDATPQEASSEVSVEDVDFLSDELRRAESLTVTPAAPGEKGRPPKGYSLLDVGF